MARKPDTRHVLPLFCDDLIASTVDMTPACFGGYMRLICYAWTRGGLPNDETSCARIAGGLEPADWATIRSRLIQLEDGRLSHDRLERERTAVAEMAERRSEAGRKGNETRWGSRTDRGAIANGSQSDRKRIAPTPSLLLEGKEERQYARAAATAGETPPEAKPEPGTHSSDCRNAAGRPQPDRGDTGAAASANGRHGAAGDEWRRAGWVHDEWARVVAVWNRTERAAPWTLATPPNGFAEMAASPGWIDTALAGIAMLAECRRFARPVPWTQFVRELDRILAGEFRELAEPRRELTAAGGARQQRRGNL
jgi:uncharacterized protein YdaU (DUF1376 family)